MQALRQLRKSKATLTAVARHAEALSAVEQQTDMLEQTVMQKQLSKALASSSKAMRADAKVLRNTEKAIDAAHEARDNVSDVQQVMTEFAQTNDGEDDEDLLLELDAMLAADARTSTAQAPADSASTHASHTHATSQATCATAFPGVPGGLKTAKHRSHDERVCLIATPGVAAM